MLNKIKQLITGGQRPLTASEVLDAIDQFCKTEVDQAQRNHEEDPSWVHSHRTDVFEEVRDKIAELRKQNEKL